MACTAEPLVNRPDLTGLNILVVDDNPDSRESLAMLLELYGASVIAADSARKALQVLEHCIPDVLLSDIAMPGEDGYALIRKVRDLPRERGGSVPAAAVTARVGAEDRHRVLAAGFQAHVPKPIDATELAVVVAQLGGLSVPPIPARPLPA